MFPLGTGGSYIIIAFLLPANSFGCYTRIQREKVKHFPSGTLV